MYADLTVGNYAAGKEASRTLARMAAAASASRPERTRPASAVMESRHCARSAGVTPDARTRSSCPTMSTSRLSRTCEGISHFYPQRPEITYIFLWTLGPK
jgi:hypothetical protein